MEEWNVNSFERKKIIELSEQINKLTVEKLNLESELQQVKPNQVGARPVIELNINELVKDFGKTQEEQLEKTLQIVKNYGVLVINRKV